MSLREEFILTQDKAKELKLDCKEPKKEDYIFVIVAMNFGGVCSKRELKKITRIVTKAYRRKERR